MRNLKSFWRAVCLWCVCLTSLSSAFAYTPPNTDLGECIRVCMSEVNTLSWQPSQQRPRTSPPSDGSWQDDAAKVRTLEQMAKAIICLKAKKLDNRVAPEFLEPLPLNDYRYRRCENACKAAFAYFDGLTEKEYCLFCADNHHYYKRFWKNPNGQKTPGSNPPGYSTPNTDGTQPDPPAPTWDRDPNTRRDIERYVYDTTTGEWVEFVFPHIDEGWKNACR
ncbi:MAG: hypothetical protein RL417_2074 [Pseudomonadota bacterium]